MSLLVGKSASEDLVGLKWFSDGVLEFWLRGCMGMAWLGLAAGYIDDCLQIWYTRVEMERVYHSSSLWRYNAYA